MNKVRVSICCTVYNHERYLSRCLEGMVKQKTDFKYEIIIHDDDSTDHSTAIIQEYQNRYPDLIKVIFQKENRYSKGDNIWWKYVFPSAIGDYIAICEGDDFWTSEDKLQKQFDVLEHNTKASFCGHIVQVVDEKGNALNRVFPDQSLHIPQLLPQDLWVDTLLKSDKLTFQTSSFFFRKEIIDYCISNHVRFVSEADVSDFPLLLLCATYGDACFISESMSCYRVFSLGSWTSTTMGDSNKKKKHDQSILHMIRLYDSYTAYRYTKQIKEFSTRKEFSICMDEGNYRALTKKKYRRILYKMSIKERIYVYLKAFAPGLVSLYNMVKMTK